MSEKDENIDQLFSDAAQSQNSPEYNEAYWTEINNVLDARDRKRKGFIWWSIAGSFMVGLLVLALLPVSTPNEDIVLYKKINATDLEIQTASLTQEFAFQNAFPHTFNENKKEFNNTRSNKTASFTTKKGSLNDLENAKTNKKFAASNQNTVQQNPSKVTLNQAKTEDYTIKQNANPVSPYSSEDSDLLEVEESILATEENRAVHDKNTLNAENAEEESKSVVSVLPILYPKTQLNNTKEHTEAISVVTGDNNRSPFKLYTKFSAGLMENYKTARPYESGAFNLSLNIEANFSDVLIRTGIGTQLTTNADLILSQRTKVYGFSVTSHQNDLSYQQLIDVYVPVEFGYKYKSTSFGIGAQVNYLVNTSMDLNQYENSQLVNTQKYRGHKNGLNSFTTQAYLWIEQEFTPRFAAGIKVGTNISGRINKNKYFNESATTNPIYGQLSLRFNLIK